MLSRGNEVKADARSVVAQFEIRGKQELLEANLLGMISDMAKLIVNVENVHLFRDGEEIDLMDNSFFLGEGSILDSRNLQKLEFLEIAIRKRRVLLEEFKNNIPGGI
jgi:hypothetical protein